MSRRRPSEIPLRNQFRIICTDRGQHSAVEIVVLTDNRDSPTDERFRELHEHLGRFSPQPVDDPVQNMEPEHVRRSITQSRSSFRIATSKRAFILSRSIRLIPTPDGGKKLRLECPRCGRDEQLGAERLDRLADAMMKATQRLRNVGVDMSRLAGYLESQ
ncbi:hypothetical protein [Nocardiopsis suaedae]|uniref:Uncharacterized protein n=1 Tax=Nocardiopsis suaedae TaxID=3018444 RepID=A0ABT4TTH7_9ACTN|nr:hypothetical protein [Nocardiopsis suaedae]MDA2808001.1 hypothetical protein [Nocardiopsis suaedae]